MFIFAETFDTRPESYRASIQLGRWQEQNLSTEWGPMCTPTCSASPLLPCVSMFLPLISLTPAWTGWLIKAAKRWPPPLAKHMRRFGSRKRSRLSPQQVLSSPQEIQCVWHPSVIISALGLVSVILLPFAGCPSVPGVCLSVGLLACRGGELRLCCSETLRTIRTKWWKGSHSAHGEQWHFCISCMIVKNI